MELITWCLFGLVLLFSWVFLTSILTYRNSHRLPPGPRGLPIIGCPWALRYDFHTLFTDLAKTYGDIVSINIMGQTIIGLNSAEVVKEAFHGASTAGIFAGRGPPPEGNEEVRYMTSFIQPGPLLSKQRKLIHKILHHYGEGLRETEKTIQEELTRVIEWLANANDPVNIDEIIYPSLINIVSILLKGKRYDYDSRVLSNVRVFDEIGGQSASAALTMLFFVLPFFKSLPIGPGKLLIQFRKAASQFHQDYFEESKEESRLEDGGVWLEDKIIRATIQEMLTAGIMTTRGALYSFFLIIAQKPEVARKVQVEIEVVVGGNRFPKLDDRLNMPYTMAAMFELLRYISHVPLGLLHMTTDDVTLQGYFTPKNTTVIYNSWCFHHDEKTYPDPWEFKPERFLDSGGRLVPADHPNRKSLMPFGTGQRSCVGETFARSRMFLFITALLQKFDFMEDPTRPLRSCDPRSYRSGIVLSPYTYHIKVTPRG